MRLSRWLVGLTASCLIPWGSGTLRADSLACTNVTNVVETDRTHLGYNPYREFRLPGTSDGCLKCPRNIVNLPIQLQLALFLSFSLSLSLSLFSLFLSLAFSIPVSLSAKGCSVASTSSWLCRASPLGSSSFQQLVLFCERKWKTKPKNVSLGQHQHHKQQKL